VRDFSKIKTHVPHCAKEIIIINNAIVMSLNSGARVYSFSYEFYGARDTVRLCDTFCLFIIALVSLSVPVLDFHINILLLFVELKRER